MLSKALIAVALAISPAAAIWPIPKHMESGNTTLFIDQSIDITYNGDSMTYTPGYAPPPGHNFKSNEIVQGGVSRSLGAIFQEGLVPWMLRDRYDEWEPERNSSIKRVTKLEIVQTSMDTKKTFRPVVGTVDESYKLTLNEKGHAKLKAASSTGILHGLETFSQLFFQHSSGQAWYTQMAPIKIKDEPEYGHRGILMDVSRHWFEIEDIKRTIDGLAMAKLNVMHLHIVDTQSWPLEIPSLPKLTEYGAYSKELTYSVDDIQGLYEYAVARGVQIIMEVDMPGHVGIEAAYPGLTIAFDKQPYQYYCSQPPCGSFKLNNTDVEDFIDTLFEDLLPRIAPYSRYFHTGGDEYKANNSLLDPALKTNDEKILQPLLQKFLTFAHKKVMEYDLLPSVWEEMVLDWNATVPKGTTIQSWLGYSAIAELAEAGHQVIDSSNEVYYLDCGRGQWLDFDNGNAFKTYYPFNDWCNPIKNWRYIYSHDPRQGVKKSAQKNVVGGEMPVWAETIDTTSIDTIIWPRANAAAEVWWSGRVDVDGKNRSQIDARPRLSEQRERMLKRGIKGTPITQLWCDMNDVTRCQQMDG